VVRGVPSYAARSPIAMQRTRSIRLCPYWAVWGSATALSLRATPRL